MIEATKEHTLGFYREGTTGLIVRVLVVTRMVAYYPVGGPPVELAVNMKYVTDGRQYCYCENPGENLSNEAPLMLKCPVIQNIPPLTLYYAGKEPQ